MNDWKNNVRRAIYMLAGVYLLFLAKNMVPEIANTSGTEHILMIVFSVFFLVIGVALVIYGIVSIMRERAKGKREGK
ncbi:MAG: hypothetical protein ACI4CT_09420 [Lachnospiraceae bacterium]